MACLNPHNVGACCAPTGQGADLHGDPTKGRRRQHPCWLWTQRPQHEPGAAQTSGMTLLTQGAQQYFTTHTVSLPLFGCAAGTAEVCE